MVKWFLVLPLTTLPSLHTTPLAAFHTLLPLGMTKVCSCVKLVVATSTHKAEGTHHNDTLCAPEHSHNITKHFRKGINRDTLAMVKGQPLVGAVTHFWSLFTTILPIIFQKLCQILLSLVVCLQRRINCCKSLFPPRITLVILRLHSITELNNEERWQPGHDTQIQFLDP